MGGWSHYSWEYEVLKVRGLGDAAGGCSLSPGAHHTAPDTPFLVMVVTLPAGQSKLGYLWADANS